jgi:hypothetical protein
VCVAGGVFFINSINLTSPKSEESELKFDKNVWVHFNTKKYENARHYMLSDLKENYLKKGIDSNKVIKLLGRPDSRFGFSYNLGLYESGFDPSYLIIEFDRYGKLVKLNVQTI